MYGLVVFSQIVLNPFTATYTRRIQRIMPPRNKQIRHINRGAVKTYHLKFSIMENVCHLSCTQYDPAGA